MAAAVLVATGSGGAFVLVVVAAAVAVAVFVESDVVDYTLVAVVVVVGAAVGRQHLDGWPINMFQLTVSRQKHKHRIWLVLLGAETT